MIDIPILGELMDSVEPSEEQNRQGAFVYEVDEIIGQGSTIYLAPLHRFDKF